MHSYLCESSPVSLISPVTPRAGASVTGLNCPADDRQVKGWGYSPQKRRKGRDREGTEVGRMREKSVSWCADVTGECPWGVKGSVSLSGR